LHFQMKKTFLFLLVISFIYIIYSRYIYSPIIFKIRSDFEKPILIKNIPKGIESLSSKGCAVCHQEIYEEWAASMHAKAYTDPLFQAYWRKDNNIWICLNCHTPLQNQQDFIITGLEKGDIKKPIKQKNEDFSHELREEGITCAACHVRDGVILGPYGNTEAPHPTKYDPMFKSTAICDRCHQVQSGKTMLYIANPCNTSEEFHEGPYAAKGYICQTCHMPEVERPVAVDSRIRKGKQHLWQGGHSPDMVKRGLMVSLDKKINNGMIDLILKIKNSGAGHKFPTGDPDRYITVHFDVISKKGGVLKSEQYSIGRWIIWKPIIVEVYENRIKPHETKEYIFNYNNSAGDEIRVQVVYHIMTERAKNKLKQKYGLKEDISIEYKIFEDVTPLNP